MPCPADFDPYRDQIRECYCVECLEVTYAASNAWGRIWRHAEAAEELLVSLSEGTHVRRELAEYLAEQRVRSDGGRGYVSFPLSDLREPGFRSRCGIGFGSI